MSAGERGTVGSVAISYHNGKNDIALAVFVSLAMTGQRGTSRSRAFRQAHNIHTPQSPLDRGEEKV